MRLTSELCEDIIKAYGKSRVETRFDTLYQEMNAFIINSGFSEFLTINQDLLTMAVHDYFLKMDETRQFYRINHVDEEKIISYTAYALLCRKPIQVYNELGNYANKFATTNERFVLLYILDYISEQLGDIHVLLQSQSNNKIKSLIDMLFQIIVNGLQSAQSLQSVIDSFSIYLHLQDY